MSERLTPDEVVEVLEGRSFVDRTDAANSRVGRAGARPGSMTIALDMRASAFDDAASLVRKHVLAGGWQRPGTHLNGVACWVDGVSERMPVLIYMDIMGRWWMRGAVPSQHEGEITDIGDLLGDRLVCPVVFPRFLPRGGK